MKNIHIIPTSQPSRIGYYTDPKDTQLYILSNSNKIGDYNPNWKPQNIYITSDEEIKEGDWVLSFLDDEGYGQAFKIEKTHFNCGFNFKEDFKKVILTTDKDLISDGVQAIDDEFLEWFVKNPSCEEIEINKQMLCDYCGQEHCDNLRCRGYEDKAYYEIIIPSEEPKERLKKILGTKHPKQDLPGTDGQIFKITVNKDWFPKQETLEEAAEKESEGRYPVLTHINPKDSPYIGSKETFKHGVRFGAKWQQERSYSEEEVIQLVSDWTYYRMSECSKSKVKFKKWFEKFKK